MAGGPVGRVIILLFTTVRPRPSLTPQHCPTVRVSTRPDQQSTPAQDKGRPCSDPGQASCPPYSNCAEAGGTPELILCIVCVSSFPRWRLQLIQYGRWNDIKFYLLAMTFSNKEEPKVHAFLELKYSVICWVLWVKSLSLLENKKWNNDQLFAVVREQLIHPVESRQAVSQSELLPRWADYGWWLAGDRVTQQQQLVARTAPATRGHHRVDQLARWSGLVWHWHLELVNIDVIRSQINWLYLDTISINDFNLYFEVSL